MINLTKIQLRQLEKKGECWHIDPMGMQPKKNWEYIKKESDNKELVYQCPHSVYIVDRKYQLGQKVKVNYNHKTTASGKDTYTQIDAVVVEIKNPARVQDLTINQLNGICKSVKETGNLFDVFKDYFNKKFAEPKAVKCVECSGSGSHRIEHHEINCPVCNGTGINHYVYYIYDEESKIMNEKLSVYWDHNRGNYFCKNKSLKIIVNPWVEIPLFQIVIK